jgi:hypothetical protein
LDLSKLGLAHKLGQETDANALDLTTGTYSSCERGRTVPSLLIDRKPCEIKKGTKFLAPYLDVIISPLGMQDSDGVAFDARLDLGADISCIPLVYANQLDPMPFGQIKIRGYDGITIRKETYRMTIGILGYPDNNKVKYYRSESGVILTDSSIGLIGLDIIDTFKKVVLDCELQEFSIAC